MKFSPSFLPSQTSKFSASRLLITIPKANHVCVRSPAAILTSPTSTSSELSHETAVDVLERSLSIDSPASTSGVPAASMARGRSKRVVDAAEVLHSTWEHRLWVWGPSALMGYLFVDGLSKVETFNSGLEAFLGVLFAYYLSGKAGNCSQVKYLLTP